MQSWPQHPLIHEINTWVWLEELKTKHNASITLRLLSGSSQARRGQVLNREGKLITLENRHD